MANFNLILWGHVALLVTVGALELPKADGKAALCACCILAALLILAGLGGFGVAESRSVARAVIGCCFALFACLLVGETKIHAQQSNGSTLAGGVRAPGRLFQ